MVGPTGTVLYCMIPVLYQVRVQYLVPGGDTRSVGPTPGTVAISCWAIQVLLGLLYSRLLYIQASRSCGNDPLGPTAARY